MMLKSYCKSIEKHHSYLSVSRSSRSKKYRYMYVLGKGDIIQGHINYECYAEKLKNELQDIFYSHDGALNRWLVVNSFFSSEATASVFMNRTIFQSGSVNIRVLVKMRKIIKLYKGMK